VKGEGRKEKGEGKSFLIKKQPFTFILSPLTSISKATFYLYPFAFNLHIKSNLLSLSFRL
jgi:hypothetical protein